MNASSTFVRHCTDIKRDIKPHMADTVLLELHSKGKSNQST